MGEPSGFRHLIGRLTGSTFAAQALTLAGGTAIAQGILAGSTPILSRLYTPAEFGTFAVYLAVVGLIVPAATAKYDQAVLLPDDERDADALVIVSVAIALLLGLAAAGLAFFLSGPIENAIGAQTEIAWLPLAGLSVVLIGSYSALTFWLNRRSAYRRISINRIAQAVIAVTIQIAAGLWQPTALGLAGGLLAGQALTTGTLAWTFVRTSHLDQILSQDRKRLRDVLRRYRHHAGHILPGQWIGSAALNIPTFAIAGSYGAAAAGFFSLAYRMVTLPTILIAAAVGDVYRRRASEAYRETRDFSGLFLKTIRSLAAVALLPSVPIILFAPQIFEFVFGAFWRTAGEYAQILTVAAVFQFVLTPVDKGAVIVGATRYVLAWNILRFVLNCAIAGLALYGRIPVEGFLVLLAAVNSALYLIDGYFEYRFSKGGSPAEPAAGS